MDPITENPAVGATEIWEFYNATADAHPMHVHEVLFEVVNRQPIFIDEMNQQLQVVPGSSALPPEPWESGLKDTVIAYPGQVTRVRARFDTRGQFVWHCHIVEHEDNEMMRPYRIGPPQFGQPGATMDANEEVQAASSEAIEEEFIPEVGETNKVFIPLVANQ
jgi:FtsP/CotA-like multicopper oxidase with cupredoxin domain